jgi:hypothetical protein
VAWLVVADSVPAEDPSAHRGGGPGNGLSAKGGVVFQPRGERVSGRVARLPPNELRRRPCGSFGRSLAV